MIHAVTHNTLISPITGLPALSVPAGVVMGVGGVGIDLMGDMAKEGILLEIGRAFEELRGPLPAPPPLCTPLLPFPTESFYE